MERDTNPGTVFVAGRGAAMANLNKVFLIGRLTQDLELRTTPGGAKVTDLRLAVNRLIPAKDGGEPREEVLFIDVTVWNRQAENCHSYLKKGRQVHIEGYLKQDSWDDKNTGEKRTKIKVEAERVQFLDSPARRDENADEDYSAPAPSRRPATPGAANSAGPSRFPSATPPPRRPSPTPEPHNDLNEPEDDIPF